MLTNSTVNFSFGTFPSTTSIHRLKRKVQLSLFPGQPEYINIALHLGSYYFHNLCSTFNWFQVTVEMKFQSVSHLLLNLIFVKVLSMHTCLVVDNQYRHQIKQHTQSHCWVGCGWARYQGKPTVQYTDFVLN